MKKHDLKQRGLPVIHDYAAGIDIGSRFHVVVVPADLAKESFKLSRPSLPMSSAWPIG